MKICFFNSDFPPKIGGIATFSWNLAYNLSLSPEVEHVQVISFKHSHASRNNYGKKLSVIYLPWLNFLSLSKEIIKYAYQFRDYDIFHATNIFPVGFLLVLFGKFIFNKPVFVTFYGTDVMSTQGSKKTEIAKYFTLKYATRAITISISTFKKTVERYRIKSGKFSIIYYGLREKSIDKKQNAVIRKKIRDKYNLSQNDFVVLTVAHLVKRKGTADLIKVISLINNQKVKLIVVGRGPEEENLKNLAQELKVKNRVIFTGLTETVDPFYLSADIFSLPSFYLKEEGDIEGFGIVFLEAQQYGLPVIGANSGGIPEAIDDGRSGFVVPERDIKAIKNKIILLADDKKLYSKMAGKAPQFIKEKFDSSKSIKKHLKLYKLYKFKNS